MLLNEDDQREHHKELLRQAQQQRLVRAAASPSISLARRMGYSMLKWGAKLASEQQDECVTLVAGERTVIVCPA